MAKNFLAFCGLVFLTLIVYAAVSLMGMFYDRMGFVSLPDPVTPVLEDGLEGVVAIQRTISGQHDQVTVEAIGGGAAQWTNPLNVETEIQPSATLPPAPTMTVTPLPTPTPVPPLEPVVYRNNTVLALRSFVAALESWLALNDRLAANRELGNDQGWRSEVLASLDDISITGDALAAVGPPPAEYAGIDALLDQVAVEANALRDLHTRALDTGDASDFKAAGESFTRVKTTLASAVQEMIAAGWSFE